MGTDLFFIYKTKIKQEYKTAFWFTFLAVLSIHLYKFVNTLPNHDSVYNYYSDQNVLGSGRWALSIACGLSSYYDLPWVIGILSCIAIALTVVVITALFKLNNPILIALSGALLAASPSTTETFFFQFTADGYFIAMLLASLGVYWSRIEETRITRHILSIVCICVSCGIYQAYVSFALILALCYFIDVLLKNIHNKHQCIRWVGRQAIIYILALAFYYIIWRFCLSFTDTPVNNYQGISQVGNISLSLISGGFVRSIKSILLYFLQFNVLKHGFPLYSILSILFLAVMAIGLVIAYRNSRIYTRKWALVLLILCLIAVIPFSCIWHFVSDSVGYRPMMLQCLNLLFILTAILFERWTSLRIKNIVCLFLVFIALHNALMANVAYFYMHRCYERSYAEGLEMMLDIHKMQDEYEFDRVAIIGTRIFEIQFDPLDSKTGKANVAGDIHILTSLLEESLLYDKEHTALFLQGTFGLDLETVNGAELVELSQCEQIQALPCWPAEKSMVVINNVLIIKLSNTILP